MKVESHIEDYKDWLGDYAEAIAEQIDVSVYKDSRGRWGPRQGCQIVEVELDGSTNHLPLCGVEGTVSTGHDMLGSLRFTAYFEKFHGRSRVVQFVVDVYA